MTQVTASNGGYHIALEMMKAYDKAFNYTEEKINDRIAHMTILNDQNRELHKLIAALTTGKKEKKADFNDNEKLKGIINRLYDRAPELFGHQKTYVFDNESDIETALQLLDGHVKSQISEVNETLMYINQGYEDRVQFTESARESLKTLNQLCEAIISRTGR